MKLKQNNDFLLSDDYYDIERLAWKFAKARFRNDIGTMTELAASDHPQPDLLEAIQKHIDGEYIYIPRKLENKKHWGEVKNSRQ